MEKSNELNSSSDLTDCTKDSSSPSESSGFSHDFYSDGTTDEQSLENEFDNELHDSGSSVRSKKSTKPSKTYHEKKNEMKQIGIKVEEVQEWIKKKVLIPKKPVNDKFRRYTADYWKCMRCLHWVDDNSILENWYYCDTCGWTHNLILSGGTKVLKSHADTHIIKRTYEFSREELTELLALANGKIAAVDFEKSLPSIDQWLVQGPTDFWKSVCQNCNDTESSTEQTNGSSSNNNKQSDSVYVGNTNTAALARAKGDALRKRAKLMEKKNEPESVSEDEKSETSERVLVEKNGDSENSSRRQKISTSKPVPKKNEPFRPVQFRIELSGTGVSKLVSDDGKSGKLNDLVYSNDTELVDREKTTKENKKKQPNQSIRRPRNNTENELTPIAKRLRRR